jgi:hypothetical protein
MNFFRIPDPSPFLVKFSYIIFKIRDAPDFRPAGYPAGQSSLFYIRYPAGYQIALPNIRQDIR